MALNIYLHELKAYRKSMLIWIVALVALIGMYMTIYPAFSAGMAEVQELFKGLPDAAKKALGLNEGSFSSLLGYYSFVMTYVTLCGAIQAMILGVSILSKEIREQTADFLMTKPVSRVKIMASKAAAAFSAIVLTNVVFVAAALLMKQVAAPGSEATAAFLLITLTLFFTQLIFLAMGIFISAVARKIKAVLPVSLGTVFGFFIIGMLGAVIGDDRVRYITPFKYFDYNHIAKNVAYEPLYIVIGAAVAAAALIAGGIVYARRDIPTV